MTHAIYTRPDGTGVYAATYPMTGVCRALVRPAYAEDGYFASVAGHLDAPEQMASGATMGATFAAWSGALRRNIPILHVWPTSCDRSAP